MYKNRTKRYLDFIFALIAVVFLMPFFFVICILVRIESRGPALFIQNRAGVGNKEFGIYKFRTMLLLEDSFDQTGELLDNYSRVTKVGNFLRKTSIDELPQLLNILLGDMSLIGPRPTLPYQTKRYTTRQSCRLTVRPGLTGLAQVNGRNSLSWEEKIEYDLEYVDNVSFFLDVKIFMKTFFVILGTEKIDFEKHDTISKHDGDFRKDL